MDRPVHTCPYFHTWSSCHVHVLFFFLWPSSHHSCCHPVIEAVTPEILRSWQGTTKWMKVVSFNNISRAVWPWLFTFLCILLMTWSVLKKNRFTYLFSVVHVLLRILCKCPPQPATFRANSLQSFSVIAFVHRCSIIPPSGFDLLLSGEFERGKQYLLKLSHCRNSIYFTLTVHRLAHTVIHSYTHFIHLSIHPSIIPSTIYYSSSLR